MTLLLPILKCIFTVRYGYVHSGEQILAFTGAALLIRKTNFMLVI